MQLLSVAVALGTLGFTFTLSRSRRGIERYGIVLVVLPLALATPLAALMASGLQLIYAFRGAGSGEGLEALATAVLRAAETQYVGHMTLLALLGALALVLIALGLSRPDRNRDEKDATEASSKLKPFSPVCDSNDGRRRGGVYHRGGNLDRVRGSFHGLASRDVHCFRRRRRF